MAFACYTFREETRHRHPVIAEPDLGSIHSNKVVGGRTQSMNSMFVLISGPLASLLQRIAR
jgi:hypothetical protein